MPYSNEHSARINDPKKYDKFRRQNDKFGTGVDVVWGISGEGKPEVQAIRFDKTKFSASDAKAWLKKHKYAAIKFEAAKEVKMKKYKSKYAEGAKYVGRDTLFRPTALRGRITIPIIATFNGEEIHYDDGVSTHQIQVEYDTRKMGEMIDREVVKLIKAQMPRTVSEEVDANVGGHTLIGFPNSMTDKYHF